MELTRLNKLEDLDLTATAVQFRNRATGQYIVLKPDPRGGGALEGGDSPEPVPWYFYQAAGNPSPYNVEIKREPVNGFNWSNYDLRTEEASFIAWNHAKRHPSATTPAAPHDWYIEQASAGFFRIKFRNGEYLQLMPDMVLYIRDSHGPKIITRPLEADNEYQQWEISANKAHCPEYYKLDGKNYKEFFVGIDADEATVRKYVTNAAQFEKNMGDTLTTRKNPLWAIKETGSWVIYHHIQDWTGAITATALEAMTTKYNTVANEWLALLKDYDSEAPTEANVKVFGFVFNEGVEVDPSVDATYGSYPMVKGWKKKNELSPWKVVKKSDLSVSDQNWYPIVDFTTLKVTGNGAAADASSYFPDDWSNYTHPEGIDMFYTKYWQWAESGCYGQRQYLQVGGSYKDYTTGDVNYHVLAHEMGHCFFSDDFYAHDKYPDNAGLSSIMNHAWSLDHLTDFDKVILRLIWKLQKS